MVHKTFQDRFICDILFIIILYLKKEKEENLKSNERCSCDDWTCRLLPSTVRLRNCQKSLPNHYLGEQTKSGKK